MCKRSFDDLGTFEYLNNLGDKFDEGGTIGVEDTTAVDQEDSFENVNLDGTTEGIYQKDSCQDVSLEGATVSEDAIFSAIGRDPNDQMLPIAFAVVEGETKDSWS